MATLSQLKQQYTYKTGVSSLLTENQRQTITTHLQEEEEARRNQGGFFGGIGYAFEKRGLGFLSSIEGIWDYTAGGLAKLFGADEWAEQQFANDWVNYNHADEWFNPSEGWQFVGDVAGGIGTSLPAIATVVAAGAIAVASGGTLSPVAAALISGAVAGLGAAGNATKQAYRETGELGGKEFGYGALVGITEGAVEGLSAGIGAGTGQIVKGISKSFGKEVAETVTRQTIGKAMIKGFIGEAFEEGLSEILDPVWARLTYDPNAKNATLQEVGYAALVGGLSGAIMGGVDVSIRNVHSMSRGNTIVKKGKSSNVISMAEQLSTYEGENHTGYEQFEMVNSTLKELQTSMQKTNGEIRTAKQRMLLGVLEQANTTAAFTPFIARSAENIVNNADVIAEKLTAYGIKDAQGNPVTFTAEQIRSGVDTKNTSTFVKALKTNSVLRALAVADATGRLSMDTAKFKDATLRGQQLSTQADLNQFIENATDVERQAVGERLSISDWNTLTNEQFQQKIVEFSQNGGVEAYQQEQATVRELQNIDPATAKKMPARLNLKKDGTVRYTDGAVNIAVTKNGDTYRIYDYDSGKYSKPLTQAEANKTIREIKKAQAAAPAGTPTTVENQQATDTQGTQQQTAPQNGTEQQGAVRKIAEQLNSERQQTQEIDTYARKNVPDYAKLNEPNKSIIRSVIRQGRAAGIADADVLSYARVAAHTGINVVFDKSLCAVAVNSQTGEKIYSDGYYDPETNKFVVNPETTRTHEALLLHELTHAIYRTADGRLILERGVKNMSQAEKDAIIKRYSDVGHGGAIELMDEINAHYAEGVLTNKNTIEKLVAEKPKLKDRILSFFKKSSTAYEGDTKLSKSAKSLYNRYKKLYNAAEYRHTAPNAETRYALQEALQQLGEYDETRKRHIENREGDTISRNYGDIVEFIKTAKRLPPVKRLHIGIISDATAKLVKTKTDVDIKNYDFVLASNFISHIFDSHGTQRTETPRNQKAVTYANIENIIETVIAPDDVTLASDENGTALKFIKDLDGKNVALTITSTKKSTLTLKSAWIIENSEGRTPSANATASARTSETSGRNLTTDSISENGKKVNRNGKKDGKRYALPDDENNSRDGLTRGQRAKFAANNTRPKVYSKIDATEIVNSIIDERLVFDDKYGSLSGKSRAQVIDTLFTRLNNTSEGYRIGVALDIADYIINNAVLTDMYDSYDDVSYSMETLSAIRRYMHKVDLSGIKGEIQYKFDKKNTVSLVWGAKQGGMAPDVIAQELQSFGINIEAINEADQFFEMLEIYEKAKSDVSKKAEKVSLTAYGSKAQIEKLRQQIARDILTAYDEKGTQSKYGKLVEKYTNQIESLTKQVRQARRINSIVNSLVDSAQYLRDIAAKRNYVGAEVFSAPELTSWLKNLGKLKYRSDLRKSGARKILLDYGKFYNTNNPLLYDADPNLTYIDNNVLDALNFIQQNADSTKPLSLEELQAAQVIMASAKHLFQYYDQMTMEGKKVRISEAATAGNAIIQKTKSRVGRGFFNNIYGVFNKIVEPRVVIKSFENYNPNGILTRAYSEITRGETAASLQYIQLVEKFDDYFKANKKYRKRLTSEYITVAGAELNVGQALSLYELSKREQAKAGLYEAGFSYVDKKGKKQTVSITESDIDALQSAFTDSDKQFIAIVEDFFNVQSKKVKTDADLQILGYTNASDDFYFPIQRDKGTIAKNITDARDLMADWANVYNFSFNKDVKTGAKNKIFVPEIWSVITRHAKQLSTYAHLTVPLKNFSQIYAKNIGDKTHVQSIRNTLNEQVWGGADAYLSKLFSDIQGKATSSSVIEKLRGAYAKYQLGANLKVIVSQLTSYPTAGIELDFRSMVKGAVMKTDYAAMDKYCDYARVRNYEKGVVRAEGVIDKVGKVGDIFTKPIQWTDRAAIGKIWNACQVQIERNDGHKIGTVENMQAAGVLLEEVIRLTQPNYTNTERSALMRSDSDIVRSFTMFTSVPLKQLSRLVESVGEYKTLRQMIKSGDTNADIQSRYKKAKKRLGKTLASITVANLMYTMVAQFFKWLYAKDRKDKDGNEISFVQDFFTDFASTTIGMFPVVKDIYNYFANDYEFSNFAYDSINSILSTTKDLFEVATKAAGGEPLETSDYMKPLRNSLYAIGQITGLPIRNINNTISGVIKRFSPATAYKYNSMFYNAQYSKDIKAALANGDTELADTIMSLMLDEDKAGNLSAGARKKLIELYEREYEVLPRSIGDSVSYNGEKIELTAKQREKFKKVYGQANGYIERMLQNKSFAKLSADKQAKAIKQVYDAYYDKALAETLGVSSDNKLLLLSKFMGIESLSIALAGISDITSDKDKNSATVQGSKKKKVIQYLLGLNFTDAQRLLILFMQGYKIGDGEYKRLTADRAKRMVISYILSLNKATQAEKAQLAQMCGVEVKNGRIVTKSLYAAK